MSTSCYVLRCGDPGQEQLPSDCAVFTGACAVIPKDTLRDFVASLLPLRTSPRFWVLSRPSSGFVETVSQSNMTERPGGGSDRPASDPGAEGALRGQRHRQPDGGGPDSRDDA